eukprot:TRINITY_DN7870_c0_g1_i3.p1 TRINITY_DN7870_c0_g1~~TRINITY_DN7870_c0_g1_i3.p1  ORF type:complete len:743 (+),score=141.69 TRINITY_DN7870_c0_g1_i3:35-2263(+)
MVILAGDSEGETPWQQRVDLLLRRLESHDAPDTQVTELEDAPLKRIPPSASLTASLLRATAEASFASWQDALERRKRSLKELEALLEVLPLAGESTKAMTSGPAVLQGVALPEQVTLFQSHEYLEHCNQPKGGYLQPVETSTLQHPNHYYRSREQDLESCSSVQVASPPASSGRCLGKQQQVPASPGEAAGSKQVPQAEPTQPPPQRHAGSPPRARSVGEAAEVSTRRAQQENPAQELSTRRPQQENLASPIQQSASSKPPASPPKGAATTVETESCFSPIRIPATGASAASRQTPCTPPAAAEVPQQCPACGNVYAPDARFCRRCGQPRTATVPSYPPSPPDYEPTSWSANGVPAPSRPPALAEPVSACLSAPKQPMLLPSKLQLTPPAQGLEASGSALPLHGVKLAPPVQGLEASGPVLPQHSARLPSPVQGLEASGPVLLQHSARLPSPVQGLEASGPVLLQHSARLPSPVQGLEASGPVLPQHSARLPSPVQGLEASGPVLLQHSARLPSPVQGLEASGPVLPQHSARLPSPVQGLEASGSALPLQGLTPTLSARPMPAAMTVLPTLQASVMPTQAPTSLLPVQGSQPAMVSQVVPPVAATSSTPPQQSTAADLTADSISKAPVGSQFLVPRGSFGPATPPPSDRLVPAEQETGMRLQAWIAEPVTAGARAAAAMKAAEKPEEQHPELRTAIVPLDETSNQDTVSEQHKEQVQRLKKGIKPIDLEAAKEGCLRRFKWC